MLTWVGKLQSRCNENYKGLAVFLCLGAKWDSWDEVPGNNII